VTERVSGAGDTPEAARNGSRALPSITAIFRDAEPIALLVLGLGVLAGVLMILTEFSTLFEVEVVTASCKDLADPDLADTCLTKGAEQHSYALVFLGALAIAMAWGAGIGMSRPAAIALVVAGVIVLAIAIIGDLPDSTKTGEIGTNFDQAAATKGIGIWFELVGGALAVVAGTLRLTRGPDGP
jgi:hypothetical protein